MKGVTQIGWGLGIGVINVLSLSPFMRNENFFFHKYILYYTILLLVPQPSYVMKFLHNFCSLLLDLYTNNIILRCLTKQILQGIPQRQFKSCCLHSKAIQLIETGDSQIFGEVEYYICEASWTSKAQVKDLAGDVIPPVKQRV